MLLAGGDGRATRLLRTAERSGRFSDTLNSNDGAPTESGAAFAVTAYLA